MSDFWIKKLGLTVRASSLYSAIEAVAGHPCAQEMRAGFNLGVAGFFAVQNVPVAAFLVQETYDLSQIDRIHKALWNQGMASMLIVLNGEQLYIFSLARLPASLEAPQDEQHRLVETLNLAADGLEAWQDWLTGIEHGRIYHEYADKFDPAERIDTVLLDNLLDTCSRLAEQFVKLDAKTGGISKKAEKQARALLMQVMFIAYLEDRGIILPEDFSQTTQDPEIDSLLSLLSRREPDLLIRLFRKLKKDFNGDLFLSPCGFDVNTPPCLLTARHMEALFDFREGLVETASGQRRFWPYQFKYIPVELISAIYDRFLGIDPKTKRSGGEYYTPLFLADLVINQTLELYPQHGTVDPAQENYGTRALDPACGSGIFLVRLFQRRIEAWRQQGMEEPEWPILVAILQRLHGFDINPDAVRVAVFSLYIALLEQKDPPAIRALSTQGHGLPHLYEKTIVRTNFFDVKTDEKYDLVIGNPPWVSGQTKNSDTNKISGWCENNQYPMPVQQIAWGFVWKTLLHLNNTGHWCLLLPGLSFLAAQELKPRTARKLLLAESRVDRIINLADLRFLIFKEGKHPTAIFFGRSAKPENPYCQLKYICPKGDSILPARRILMISSLDHTILTPAELLKEPRNFRLGMWMHSPDRRLFQWLNMQPKLSNRACGFKKLPPDYDPEQTEWWGFGKGMEIDKEQRASMELPYIPVEELHRYVLPHREMETARIEEPRRFGFTQGYAGVRIVIAEGLRRGNIFPVRAAFVDKPAQFNRSVFILRGKLSDSNTLKLLTVILNSRLAIWFFLHTAAYVGMEREKISIPDVLELPFPLPDELDDPETASQCADEIIIHMNELLSQSEELPASPVSGAEENLFNNLVYRYFGLSRQEIALIEDTVELIFPSIQPRHGRIPPLWQYANDRDFERYADALGQRLNNWLKSGLGLDAQLTGYTPDLAVLKLTLATQSGNSFTVTNDETALRQTLNRLWDTLARQGQDGNLFLMPDIRLFLDGSLYLIKPRNRRYWLRATAFADADNVAAELFAAGRLKKGGNA
ncbi:MAG: N-6 DNA methylase [Gammaproteobacteria bacterium]|nr:N-6 DNA methylase [Gammaproteobacteria bacterium]